MSQNVVKAWFFEVSVSKDGGGADPINRFAYGKKCQWVRKGEPHTSFGEAQAAAIVNGERPYRIVSQYVPAPAETPAAVPIVGDA